jgi:predicted outer membrane repeat protein
MESFIRKPSSISGNYRKPIAFVGITTLAMGLGVVQSVPATASNTQAGCNNTNTVQPGASPDDSVLSVQRLVDAEAPLICLNGSFEFSTDDWIDFPDGESEWHFYGIGNTTLTAPDAPVFFSDASDPMSIIIENLSITDSGSDYWSAVVGQNVTVIDSTFTGNLTGFNGGAIFAYGSVNISNSTFVENTSTDVGGAIAASGTATVSNSTFVDNTSALDGGAISSSDVVVTNSTFSGNTTTGFTSFGGAIYSAGSVDITNSTFLNNTAAEPGSEGGAIYAKSGQVIFSTFVNNQAPEPSGGDIPGNSIYKEGDLVLELGANIFAGPGSFPELGKGADAEPTNFNDLGGNVFSTGTLTEEDFEASASSVFSKSLAAIFGTTSPTLATFAPNTFGTQTFGLATDSPARSAVTTGAVFDSVSTDQRGASRTKPYSAGAFELDPPAVAPATTSSPALARTGTDNSPWLSILTAGLMAVGASFLAFRSSLKRRKA